ncbi:MAG TPA: hypothetical protein VFM61_03025 [Pseudidiomarina sp.]|nr:hypothetical protein [Pseudidiomarina sp.]
MKSIWRIHTTASTAEDIQRLQTQVKRLAVEYHEVVETDRIQSIRKRWRLFAEPVAQQELNGGAEST